MKKTVKKLTLSKETVRSLNLELGQLAGGSLPGSNDAACQSASCAWTCLCDSNQYNCVQPLTTVSVMKC
jgi:hypothetical protein